jgi:hypothetical protein
VAELVVLDAAADLVEAPVGDTHDMERVRDPGCMIEVRGQPGPIRLGQIGCDHLDLAEPSRIRARAPSTQISGTVSGHQIDHPTLLQINQAGHIAS